MGRRPLSEKNIRSLTKVSGGKSYAIIIPREMVNDLKWRARQKLVINRRGKKLVIEDWEP
jgi:hypothetical protein